MESVSWLAAAPADSSAKPISNAGLWAMNASLGAMTGVTTPYKSPITAPHTDTSRNPDVISVFRSAAVGRYLTTVELSPSRASRL
jgi:hypothetical protein